MFNFDGMTKIERKIVRERLAYVQRMRKKLRARVKYRVKIRDKCVCQICGKSLPYKELTIDHIIPLILGGTNSEDNLRAACLSCNRSLMPLTIPLTPMEV